MMYPHSHTPARYCRRVLVYVGVCICLLTNAAIAQTRDSTEPHTTEYRWDSSGRCGTNCLFFLVNLESSHSYDDVAKLIPVTSQGSSLADLENASDELGINAQVVKVPFDEISSVRVPFILHVDLLEEGGIGHFFTVLEIQNNEHSGLLFTVADGGDGEIKVLQENQVRRNYSGFLLVKDTQGISWFTAVTTLLFFVLGVLFSTIALPVLGRFFTPAAGE